MTRRLLALPALLAVPAAALTAAALLGDVSSPGDDLDHLLEPLPVPEPVLAVAGVLGAALLLALWVRHAGADRPALACLTLAGLLLGAGYRVVTAGVVGANIGGALVLLLGGPLLFALLAAAAVLARGTLRG